jgi:Protein of unknown function (DUF1569)
MKSLASADVLSETSGRLLRVCAEDRALWGKMTATQMVRHLGFACEIPLGERTAEPVMGPMPKVVKFVALRSGLQWPKNLKTTTELVRALDEDCSAEFDELVAVAIEKMEKLAGAMQCTASHPMFGPMTAGDWMRWGYLHADHHLRQFGR